MEYQWPCRVVDLSNGWECVGEGKQQPIWKFFYKNVIGQSSTAETLLLIDAMDLPDWFLKKKGIFGIV